MPWLRKGPSSSSDSDKMLSAHSLRVGAMKELQVALEKEAITVGRQ